MSYLYYIPTPIFWVPTTQPLYSVYLPVRSNTMELSSYFPQEMLNELGQLNNHNNNITESGPNTTADTVAAASTTATAGADANPGGLANQDNAEQATATQQGQEATRFEVVHKIEYNPWNPTPANIWHQTNVVGTCATLREANQLAMQEVCQKYGELAHVGRNPVLPVNRDWLHRGTREAGRWPNTWDIVDGRLRFAVINSRLHWTVRAQIVVIEK